MEDKELQKKLEDITKILTEDYPELGQALKDVKGKDFHVAVTSLVPLLQKISTEVDMAALLERSNMLFQTETGTERLNPKYESYLAERIQFDGDAPELRFGALPPDAKPAVPVDTTAKNPSVIGSLLQTASDEVTQEFKRITAESTEVTVHDADPVGYERGNLPTLRKVLDLTGSDIAKMSTKEKKENTWHFISTTQGRRSAVPVLTNSVLTLLREKGYTISEGKNDNLLFSYEWVVHLVGGENSTQNNFPYIEVATQAFINAYFEWKNPALIGSFLEIKTVDKVAERIFGWSINFYGA